MESVAVLGCRVDTADAREAVARIVALARGDRPSLVVTLGTEMIVHAQRDPAFRAIVNGSALSLCDTIGVVLAARSRGATVAGRVAGVDLIEPLCVALAAADRSIYLLGAKGDTAARAAETLRAHVPGLRIAGARDGYFAPDEEPAVAAAIAASGANVLFVGLGSPRQERFVATRLAETGCAVGIGVGGSFDVLAGTVRRAPKLWRRLNLEWLHRLLLEPARFRRQLALPYFVWLALRERVLHPPARRFS